jgi:hypothetical protein
MPRGKRRSSIDRTKRTPTALHYLPAQAANPANSFFEVYDGDDRRPLDVMEWIKHCPLAHVEAPPLQPTDTDGVVAEAKVEADTAEWCASSEHPGESNARFFDFARALRPAGILLGAIRERLNFEAQNGLHPDKRKRQVSSIMTSLRKHEPDHAN